MKARAAKRHTGNRRGFAVRPIAVLPLGFIAIILLGASLLMLPAASAEGTSLSFADALFTATSASCVTGLVVVDTGTYFSLFGQIVLLALIQLGGLGFMTAATILFSLTGRRVSLRERMTLAEGFGESRLQGMVALGQRAVGITLLTELAGAVALSFRFVPLYGMAKGIWFSIFHSVSAFCNAGFDLIGGYRSFTGFSSDAFVCCTLMLLIVCGSLGFAVILDLCGKKRFSRLRLHTKLVLTGSALLILLGAACFLLIESDNPNTLGNLPFGERVLNSLFQSVTLRTAGFNTIDQFHLRDASKGVGILLMLAGGAPAGTAGGLKITTLMTLFLSVVAYVRGKRDTVAFGRTISAEQVRRALTVFCIGVMFLAVSALAVSIIEQGLPAGEFGLLNQLYEATSAFCTVGVSLGVTAALTAPSRILLILMMYVGRVGLLSVTVALIDSLSGETLLSYPQEEILIG